METVKLPYQKTNKFSKLIIDYINESPKLEPFINHFPTLDNFEKQIKEKSTHDINRDILVSVLENQNSIISLSDLSKSNIQLLKNNNTFTITTGHQLCLFTGPLYFIYKIISTINLTEQLAERYLENHFVPIFWMASEDHDIQEINHINLFGNKIEWNTKNSGAVGRMNLKGIADLLKELESILGKSENAKRLLQLFENSYLKHRKLSDATRFLVNELFGKYGLVIIDGDDKKLKKQFIPQIKKDILEQGFVGTIQESSKKLARNYFTQAFVRDINFFKLSDENRLLITKKCSVKEIDNYPEKFSPNVLLRPIYQESVLPNIATIGGGAEIAYWMQLKYTFQKEKIPYPILVLRNSAILLNIKQNQKRKDLGFSPSDLFLDKHQLQKKFIASQTDGVISLQYEIERIESVYASMLNKIFDVGLQNSIKSQLQKQQKSFKQLEQKLLRLEKQKYENSVQKINKLKAHLFPNNSLQERYDNFISFYLESGDNFIKILKKNLDPLDLKFLILEIMTSK